MFAYRLYRRYFLTIPNNYHDDCIYSKRKGKVMVTITSKKYSEKDSELAANALENIKCREGVCLSTDTKPTDWENGSTLLEMDTGNVYVFDKANNTWRGL